MREAGKRDSREADQQDPQGPLEGDRKGAPGAPFVHPAETKNILQTQPIDFVGSFPDFKIKLEPALPEVAFIGRSNVGKSSLLNALVRRPGLARVSSSPGKTQLLNFYRLPGLYLVDLPGYGYARASKSSRAGYRRLILGYLTTRPTLAGVVWLLDIRREPSAEDREIQQLLAETRRPVLAVLTKADKLTRSGQSLRVRQLAGALELPPDQIEVTSSRTGLGIDALASSIGIATQEGP